MQKKLVVLGAGGLGKDVMWQISEVSKTSDNYDILGFIDDSPTLTEKSYVGYKILGSTDWLLSFKDDICVIIAIANPIIRKLKYEELSCNTNISFPTIVAPGAKCSEHARFGQGCLICDSCIISPDVVLGDFVISHYHCTIGHDANLGNFVTLYPGVNVSGNVHIGDFCEIGTGASIIQGKTINENTFLGAGSVTVTDIPANCTAVGVPSRVIKTHK